MHHMQQGTKKLKTVDLANENIQSARSFWKIHFTKKSTQQMSLKLLIRITTGLFVLKSNRCFKTISQRISNEFWKFWKLN